MIGRLQSIADNIKTKLPDHSSAIKEIEQRLSLLQGSKGENIDACMQKCDHRSGNKMNKQAFESGV